MPGVGLAVLAAPGRGLPESEGERHGEPLAVRPGQHDGVQSANVARFRGHEELANAVDELSALLPDHVVDDEMTSDAIHQGQCRHLQQGAQALALQQPVEGVMGERAATGNGRARGTATGPDKPGNEGGDERQVHLQVAGVQAREPRKERLLNKPVGKLYACQSAFLSGGLPASCDPGGKRLSFTMARSLSALCQAGMRTLIPKKAAEPPIRTALRKT